MDGAFSNRWQARRAFRRRRRHYRPFVFPDHVRAEPLIVMAELPGALRSAAFAAGRPRGDDPHLHHGAVAAACAPGHNFRDGAADGRAAAACGISPIKSANATHPPLSLHSATGLVPTKAAMPRRSASQPRNRFAEILPGARGQRAAGFLGFGSVTASERTAMAVRLLLRAAWTSRPEGRPWK